MTRSGHCVCDVSETLAEVNEGKEGCLLLWTLDWSKAGLFYRPFDSCMTLRKSVIILANMTTKLFLLKFPHCSSNISLYYVAFGQTFPETVRKRELMTSQHSRSDQVQNCLLDPSWQRTELLGWQIYVGTSKTLFGTTSFTTSGFLSSLGPEAPSVLLSGSSWTLSQV